MKYNEDYEIPHKFILEVCRRLKIFSCQNQINKWESTMLMSLDHRLFVSQQKFDSWSDKLQNGGRIKGPFPFTFIDDYFSDHANETEGSKSMSNHLEK
jgi:hypothetical protein